MKREATVTCVCHNPHTSFLDPLLTFEISRSCTLRAAAHTAAALPAEIDMLATSSRLLLLSSAQAFNVGMGLRSRAMRATLSMSADDEFAGYVPKTVFMFPGQGAQKIGMGVEVAAEVPAAAELYAKASEILGYDLLAKCTDGPKEELDSTVISQPAIFVASMAAVEKLRASEGGAAVIDSADVACGLSLGEYTALAFAGAISFEDGVKITKARGEAMQAAAEAAESGMVSIIGLDSDKVADVCAAAAEATGEKIQIANFLCPGNYACSGGATAVAKVMSATPPLQPQLHTLPTGHHPRLDMTIMMYGQVMEIAKPEFKARMAVKLAVAGAFHTDFMAPAVDSLKEARQHPATPLVCRTAAPL